MLTSGIVKRKFKKMVSEGQDSMISEANPMLIPETAKVGVGLNSPFKDQLAPCSVAIRDSLAARRVRGGLCWTSVRLRRNAINKAREGRGGGGEIK